MPEIRNLEWLVTQLQLKLNADTLQADKSFGGPPADPSKNYRALLNEAGDLEVENAKLRGHKDRFIKTHNFAWPAAQVTLAVPTVLIYADLRTLRDITNSVVGEPIAWSQNPPSDAVFMLDNRTFQWGDSGPATDTTIRATYTANYTDLIAAIDEPDLIAPRFRWLLVWSALSIAQTLGDLRVPQDVAEKHQEWRETWYAYLARGFPSEDNVARVIDRDYDIY